MDPTIRIFNTPGLNHFLRTTDRSGFAEFNIAFEGETEPQKMMTTFKRTAVNFDIISMAVAINGYRYAGEVRISGETLDGAEIGTLKYTPESRT